MEDLIKILPENLQMIVASVGLLLSGFAWGREAMGKGSDRKTIIKTTIEERHEKEIQRYAEEINRLLLQVKDLGLEIDRLRSVCSEAIQSAHDAMLDKTKAEIKLKNTEVRLSFYENMGMQDV